MMSILECGTNIYCMTNFTILVSMIVLVLLVKFKHPDGSSKEIEIKFYIKTNDHHL